MRSTERYRFGAFELDATSGELVRIEGGGRESIGRLPPQPASLLVLLVSRRGALVTREEIREHVWPGVEIELDAAVHYCIRQIRSALGDSASSPRYIQTLPKRGYRFIAPVEAAGGTDPGRRAAPGAERSPRGPLRSGRLLAALAVAVLVAFGGARLLGGSGAGTVRVGVMPFVRGSDPANGIAEGVVEHLMRSMGDRVLVVGPSTTASYAASDDALVRLGELYELDYVVNARFLEDRNRSRVLAELIRISDGAHIWVRSYESLADARRIEMEISGAVAERLGPEAP